MYKTLFSSYNFFKKESYGAHLVGLYVFHNIYLFIYGK